MAKGFAGILVATVAVGVAGGYALGGLDLRANDVPKLFSGSCRIKGNISLTGERIYHVPGQKYYPETNVRYLHGERWFCSEAEARQAGWRRSKV